MKLLAVAILVGALLIAGTIFATRSRSEDSLPDGPIRGPIMESTCMMAGGVWIDGQPDDTQDPFDGRCMLP